MILRLNGEEKNFSDKTDTVKKLLEAIEVNAQRVAVEINGGIVDPKLFSETLIHDRDKVEIVSFVGGG